MCPGMAMPVTSRKRLDGNQEECGDYWREWTERWQPEPGGLAPKAAALRREVPQRSCKNHSRKYPPGVPKRGIIIPNGWIYWL